MQSKSYFDFKAGLGRTGTLIACYAIKHFRFPAAAFIGWIRICRPGSVLGPQQNYLLSMEEKLLKKGEEYRANLGLSDDLCLKFDDMKISSDGKKKQMNEDDIKKGKLGDHGQGERLYNVRKK